MWVQSHVPLYILGFAHILSENISESKIVSSTSSATQAKIIKSNYFEALVGLWAKSCIHVLHHWYACSIFLDNFVINAVAMVTCDSITPAHPIKVRGMTVAISGEPCWSFIILTHLPMNKMAAISQTINAFSWTKSFIFRLKFHWSLFHRVN